MLYEILRDDFNRLVICSLLIACSAILGWWGRGYFDRDRRRKAATRIADYMH